MKILFHLGHPAHFHLFKNVIKSLKENGHQTYILIKKKDILEELLMESGFVYQNILPQGRKDDKISIAFGQLKQDIKLFSFCLKQKPVILIGTSVAISHVGKLLGIPSINLNEDDADVVPLYAKLAYPWASNILAPNVCGMGKWINKTIFYHGYHELAYLHPNNFVPKIEITKKYISLEKPYFILRFAKLGAHHDTGIKGISDEIAAKLVEQLTPHGQVYITSERKLNADLEPYRIQINPIDIHHVMAFAKIYIGDSQTMAAESGVLGVPFIRYNDFVGRIGYLEELENKYQLGYGIRTNELAKLFSTIEELVNKANLGEIYKERRLEMLSEKIDYAAFLVWFIENYPKSVKIMKENTNYQYKFK
jgi:predicted glycosyltransferase